MTYSPINIPAFVASYSGAIAGMGVSGWIVNPVQGSYDDVTQIAGAFAQAFDIAWNDAATLNNLELASITAIVSNEFKQRGPELTNPLFKTDANWDRAARACIALVLESDAYFAGQGINPGTGGGGGGSILGLSDVVFVDKNGSGAAPDGSIANPFTTITAAVEAVVGFGNSTLYTFMITPYDYSAEPLIELPPNPLIMNFIGMNTIPSDTVLPSMLLTGTSGYSVYFENCTVGTFTGAETDGITDGTENGGCGIVLKNANAIKVTGNSSYLTANGTPMRNLTNSISTLSGTFGTINFSGCSFSDSEASITCDSLLLQNKSAMNCGSVSLSSLFISEESSLSGNVDVSGGTGGTGYAIDSTVGNGTWTGFVNTETPFEFRSSTLFGLNLDVTANAIAMDSASMASFGRKSIFNDNCQTVNAIASLDSEIRFTSGPNADHNYQMSDPNHVIVSESTLTANRSYKIDTSGGTVKQLFIIDNYGQGGQLAVTQGVDSAVIYTFLNSPGEAIRAKFAVLSEGGNTIELHSVEVLNR